MRSNRRITSVFVCVLMIAAAFSMMVQTVNLGSAALYAEVTMEPETLNPKSNGRWVTAYIELPSGYDVNDIDVSTILLEGVIPAEGQPTAVGDHDGDGISDLMVKFSRAALEDLLLAGSNTLNN